MVLNWNLTYFVRVCFRPAASGRSPALCWASHSACAWTSSSRAVAAPCLADGGKMTRQLASFIGRSSFRRVQISAENESESGEIWLNGSGLASRKFELGTCEELRGKKSTNAFNSRHHMQWKFATSAHFFYRLSLKKTSMWLQKFSLTPQRAFISIPQQISITKPLLTVGVPGLCFVFIFSFLQNKTSQPRSQYLWQGR